MNWICVQDSAREHYAMPRALHQRDRLELLFTEIWAGPLLRQLACGPIRPLATRYHPALAGSRVIHWTQASIWRELTLRVAKKEPIPVTSSIYDLFIQNGQWFSRHTQKFLEQQKIDLQGKIIFSYDTTALELFQWAKQRGAICVLGQMDPARTEAALMSEERAIWPGWSMEADDVPDAYHSRREQEWELADCVLVNSRWSANALAEQGVPQKKLAIIPLCYETQHQKLQTENQFQLSGFSFSPSRPLRILFLGQVILRKGIQYLIEAARQLQDESVHFDIVGPVCISDYAVKSAPPNLTFHGRANRDETSTWYNQSDVFVLPTLSDGFAITQIEAMAHGLPVIATPNCGEVVTDGEDGFVVQARDPSAMVQVVRHYLAEPENLVAQRRAAIAKSKQFSLERLAANLLNLEYTLERAGER